MIFYPMSPANKFGYFKVGDNFCSYSQVEAQEYARRTRNKIEWIFNDEFFSAIDWTVEPTESLKELYADRARQIRNDYDYIVLSFSGGADSQNILATFQENNIYLDEILTYHSCEGLGDKFSTSDNMIEVTMAAMPEANKYLEQSPNTLHRIVDISSLIKNYWADNLRDLKYNFIYYNNGYMTPFNTVSTNLPTILPEYRRLTESGKRVCFIHGTDKPYIGIDQGRWYFAFHSDVIGASFSMRRQMEEHPVHDVLFYWDPDAWKIVVKQAHALKNHIYKNHKIVQSALTGGFNHVPHEFASRIHIFGNRLPTTVLKSVVYPHWRNDIVDVGKEMFTLYGTKAKWWLTSGLPGSAEQIAGAQYVAELVGSSKEKPTQDNYFSKRYYF